MHELLWDIWRDFRDDDAIEVAILTGAGEAFCAGADLKTHLPYWADNADALLPRRKIADGLGGITRGLHRIYKPIVAAVNGWALAGGFENALACDIRIASERAMFGSFEVRRGFHHGDGGIVRLVNICGAGMALEMLLTGEPIGAERARQVNLVSKVVPHQKLMEEAEKVAAQILRNDQWAVRSAKETILNVIGRPLDDQLAYEAFTGYSGAANPTLRGRLREFYERTDEGRTDKKKIDS
jgi:enoyl-CoA hydratase/carnithine racemase